MLAQIRSTARIVIRFVATCSCACACGTRVDAGQVMCSTCASGLCQS